MKACLLLLLTLSLFSVVLSAEEDHMKHERRSSITVTGEAVVLAKPDQARLQFAVLTQSEDAQRAARENANKTDQVMNNLRKKFSQDVEIRTISYSLSPNYVYPREGGEPRITGYTASNTIEVKTGKLDTVGQIIDIAVDSGANNVQSLEFTLKDDLPVRADALKRATTQARAKAEAIASALNVRVVRVLQAQESGEVGIPMERMAVQKMAVADAEATTPVQAGTIEVRANVTLKVEVQ